jgi:hypothetical protein
MLDALLLPTPISARRGISLGAGASIALHLLLALTAIWLSPLRTLVTPPPQAVTVEIVTPEQFAALERPAPASIAPTPDAAPPAWDAAPYASEADAAPAVSARPQAAHATHRATTLYSADMLKEPAMARIRQTLTQLVDSEQMVQLCNIEAIEQIRRAEIGYAPDSLVAYAMSDPVTRGFTLTAPGAAFRSRRKWYGISLTCTVAPDMKGVTAFEFTVGEPIPEDQWEAHNLNAEDSEE